MKSKAKRRFSVFPPGRIPTELSKDWTKLLKSWFESRDPRLGFICAHTHTKPHTLPDLAVSYSFSRNPRLSLKKASKGGEEWKFHLIHLRNSGKSSWEWELHKFQWATHRASFPCRTFKTLQKSHFAMSQGHLLNKQGSKWNIWWFIPSSISSGQKNGYRNQWGDVVCGLHQICSTVAPALSTEILAGVFKSRLDPS